MNKPPTTHTPGPWRISGVRADTDHLLIEHGRSNTKSPLICMLYHDQHRLPMESNARLIASAPTLLVCLTALLSTSDTNADETCRWCGRSMFYEDGSRRTFTYCPSDDCPGFLARKAVTDAEGRP